MLRGIAMAETQPTELEQFYSALQNYWNMAALLHPGDSSKQRAFVEQQIDMSHKWCAISRHYKRTGKKMRRWK